MIPMLERIFTEVVMAEVSALLAPFFAPLAKCSAVTLQPQELLTVVWTLEGQNLNGAAFSTSCKDCKDPVSQLLHNAWGSKGLLGLEKYQEKSLVVYH